MKINIVFTVIMIVALQSCSPDRFTMNYRNENILFGTILSDLDSFEQINDNSFLLKGGTVAIRRTLMTQSNISLNYKMIKGDTLRFFTRNVVHKFNPENGIEINLNSKSCNIKENGILQNQNDVITLSKKDEKYINIRTVGKLTHFRHDCDDIVISSLKPATEYLIIQVPKNTEVLISGMEFEKVMRTPSEENIDF